MSNSKPDLSVSLKPYLKNWKWLLLGALLGICTALVYLRYTVPLYSAEASIQILEDTNSGSELNVLEDLNLFSGGNSKIEDEVRILSSRSHFIDLVKRLKLNASQMVVGNIKSTEIYDEKEKPFSINFLAADSIVSTADTQIYVEVLSKNAFRYKKEESDSYKNHEFGEKFSTDAGDLILIPNKAVLDFKERIILLAINPITDVADGLREAVGISPADSKDSDIINLYLEDPVKQRAVDILNTLIQINNQNAVTDKKAVADRTSRFINDRIADIYSNLSDVDSTAERFKASRGIADLGSQSNVNFNQSAAGQQELQNANIQLNIAQSMQELIANQDDHSFIPTNVGISDPGIANSAQRYNELVSERNRLLESSNEKNPVIVKLDQQLEGLRQGMQSSLNNVANNLNLQVNSLSKQLSQINSRIYAAPKNERALRDISRRQQTTESLYLYLLQKREESQITFASASPKSKVIDSAYGSTFPVAPSAPKVFLAYTIIGLLIPLGFVYVKDLLDNKIHNKIQLEELVENNASVVAELPKLKQNDVKLVQTQDRSVLAESLRILRTNLDYLLQRAKHSNGKVVLVTSSVPGEGKTFVSSNLSVILANTGKKVLLVGADVRNPQLYSFYEPLQDVGTNKPSRRTDLFGLTEYLSQENSDFGKLITKLEVGSKGLDLVYSGKVMPNPTELLMSEKLETFFDIAKKKYDYVVVDSAPLLVVADTLEISKYADQMVYITKAGVTEKKVLEYPLRLLRDGKLKNLSFVVNGVKDSNLGYGSKYGYGYGASSKKWWQFSKN